MASLNILGFFALADGREVTSSSALGTKRKHFHYSSSFTCSTGTSLPVDLRIYAAYKSTLLSNNTVVFVFGRAYFPPRETVQIDAFHMFPVPGDPDSETYDDHIPDFTHPIVIGVGPVPSQAIKIGDAHLIPVHAHEYVRDSLRVSPLQCLVETSTKRWANTRMPNVNSTVFFSGICHDIAQNGSLIIDVENIVNDIGGSSKDASMTASDGSPTKRRKFQAHASASSLPLPRAPFVAQHSDLAVIGTSSKHDTSPPAEPATAAAEAGPSRSTIPPIIISPKNHLEASHEADSQDSSRAPRTRARSRGH